MISILMTTYNCAQFIRPAIQSILNQTFRDFELLIVDDGSSDETENTIWQFTDKRIRYIKREHKGRSEALNYGLKISSNEIIALMDADDISHPERIAKQIKFMQTVESNIIITDGAYFSRNNIIYKTDIPENPDKFNKLLLLHGTFFHPTMMFYKNHVLKSGGYDNKISANEDHELWLRLKNKTKFIILKDELYYYRFRKNSLSNNVFIKNPGITYEIQTPYFRNILNKNLRLESESEEYTLKGWREYFYGSVTKMRNEWSKIKISNWSSSMFIAYGLSYLPKKIVNFIKIYRVGLRTNYLINRFYQKNKTQLKFNQVLKDINCD